jgi:hypothetical protein
MLVIYINFRVSNFIVKLFKNYELIFSRFKFAFLKVHDELLRREVDYFSRLLK